MNTTAIKNQEIKEIKPNQGSDKGKEDWVEERLGDIFETITGNTPPKKEKDNYGNEVPFIKPPQIHNNIISSSIEFLSHKGKEKARILPENSILITCIGNLGRVGINKIEVAFNQQINAIVPVEGILPLFTFYQAQSIDFRNQLEKLSTSTTVALVNKTNFNTINFKIPPLPIQRAIVKKIEELFSSLDSGITDLKKAQEQLVIYRQAVLKKAFEGYEEIPFEEIITTTQNGISKRKGTEGSEIKVLRLADITNLEIDNSSSRTIVLNDDELIKYKLNEGDLIVIRVNGSINLVGRFIYVNKKDEKEVWAFCDHFIRCTLDLSICVPKFYFYFFQLSKIRKFINNNMVSSAGQNTVSQSTVKSISVPLITIVKQHQIVREIESRLSVCDKVEESITESLEKAQALRQSILKKAFEGRLLSNAEIEQCKREKDYEPASVLLEKIKKEKINKK